MHKPRIHPIEIDCLKTLYQLRYLSTEQIRKRWFPTKTKQQCQARLSRLRQYDVLERVRIVDHPDYPYAWRLGDAGLKLLARHCKESFPRYEHLRTMFLIHLLQTNDIYLKLRPQTCAVECLPFEWLSSHAARIPYVAAGPHPETGALERRKKVLGPDATITPESSQSIRTFLEVDRSTESIKSTTGRTSIERKLQAYQKALHSLDPHSRKTWYAKHFGDTRQAQILFVVQPSPECWRRREAIARMAKKFPELSVIVRSLEDMETIAKDIGIDATVVPVMERTRFEVATADLEELRAVLHAGFEACAQLPKTSRERSRFEELAVRTMPAMSRLGLIH